MNTPAPIEPRVQPRRMATTKSSPYCIEILCRKRSVHSCCKCQKPFCSNHCAHSTAWGTFVIDPTLSHITYDGGISQLLRDTASEEMDRFVVPYDVYRHLICYRCACEANYLPSWYHLVRKHKWVLKYVTDPEQKKRAWKAFKTVHGWEDSTSYLLKNQMAKSYFDIKGDYFEMEDRQRGVEGEMSEWVSLFQIKEISI